MQRLQSKKVIEIINGKGCYISTPKALKIAFYLPETTLDFPNLQKLFNKHIDKSLRIEVELHPWQRYGIKPYKFNGRKICILGQNCLQTFMYHDIKQHFPIALSGYNCRIN